MLVLMEDENSNSSHDTLLDYCCTVKQAWQFTFHMLIDPGGYVMDNYSTAGVPINIVLNQQMIIKYEAVGDYSGVDSAVSQLCK